MMNPPSWGGTTSPGTRRGIYFFLSYAHSPPMPREVRTDADARVGGFFRDLSDEVARRARPASGLDIGFFDQQIPLGSDPKQVLVEALSLAEVFVPLYSPGYLSRSWPMEERESFRARLTASRVSEPSRRIMPVLWIPFLSWDDRPEVAEAVTEALDVGGYSAAYAENGMRALCMLTSYRDEYARVLARLAERIVKVAERSPLGRSRAPRLDEISGRLPEVEPAFLVAVLAPTEDTRPPGRRAHGYGPLGRLWQPFGERQELPAADHAASTAERLGLPTRVTDAADEGGLLRSLQRYPTVLLIDPWIAADPGTDSRVALRDFLRRLPDWVVPMVVANREDPQYAQRGEALADEVMGMLSASERSRGALVRDLKEFVEVMPVLITEARRQYLRNVAVFPPPGPSVRPRLDDLAIPPDLEEER